MPATDPQAPAAVARILLWRPLQMAIYLASMAVLARLLPPEAFGVFAIAAAVFWCADTAVDFGISSHLIRDKAGTLAPATLSAAYGLWWLMALLLTAATGAVAFALAVRGGTPGLAAALGVAAAMLPLSPLIRLRETQRLRALDTAVLAWLPSVAALVGLAVSVGGALAGLGGVALIAGLGAERLVQAIVLARPAASAPRVAPALRGAGQFVAFGGTYTATVLLPRATEVARLSVVAAWLGAPAVGVLNRATQIANLNDRVILEAVMPVAMPVMADAMREGAGAGRVYAAKIDYLSALCWPAALGVAVLAEPLVLVLLGAGWMQAVLPVQILALGGLTYPVNRMSAKFFALIGRERTMLRIQAVQQGVSLALVATGAMLSLAAVCAGIALAQAAKAAQVSLALHRSGLHDRALLRAAILRGVTVTALALVGPVAAVVAFPGAPGAALATGLAGGTAGWALGIALTRHRLGADLRRLLGRGGGRPVTPAGGAGPSA